MMDWWTSLSGAYKGWLESLGAAVITAGVDVAVQELTAGGLSLAALDYKQIAGAALIAGLVYVRAHLAGLMRNPDGSPVVVVPPVPHG